MQISPGSIYRDRKRDCGWIDTHIYRIGAVHISVNVGIGDSVTHFLYCCLCLTFFLYHLP